MSCSPFDLRDYFFGELPEEHRRRVDLHTKSCAVCREELTQLRSTQTALLSLADEEIPQRIGFVSDRVYEPSLLMRWWRTFWGSAPRLGFASAAMLSAIIVSATQRPAPLPQPAATVDVVKLQADVSRQLNEAVQKEAVEDDARHEQRTSELLAAAAKRFDAERKLDIERASENFAILEKFVRRDYRAAVFEGDSR